MSIGLIEATEVVSVVQPHNQRTAPVVLLWVFVAGVRLITCLRFLSLLDGKTKVSP